MKVTINPPPQPQGTVTIEDIPMEVARIMKHWLATTHGTDQVNRVLDRLWRGLDDESVREFENDEKFPQVMWNAQR